MADARKLVDRIRDIADTSFANHIKETAATFGQKTALNVATESRTRIIDAIKKEITEDPEKRGYAGKTPKQIADLLNASYEVNTGRSTYIKRDRDGIPILLNGKEQVVEVENIEKRTARFAVIISGIPFAPNSIEVAEVEEALL